MKFSQYHVQCHGNYVNYHSNNQNYSLNWKLTASEFVLPHLHFHLWHLLAVFRGSVFIGRIRQDVWCLCNIDNYISKQDTVNDPSIQPHYFHVTFICKSCSRIFIRRKNRRTPFCVVYKCGPRCTFMQIIRLPNDSNGWKSFTFRLPSQSQLEGQFLKEESFFEVFTKIQSSLWNLLMLLLRSAKTTSRKMVSLVKL